MKMLKPYKTTDEGNVKITLAEVLLSLEKQSEVLPETVSLLGTLVPTSEFGAIVTHSIQLGKYAHQFYFNGKPLNKLADKIVEDYIFQQITTLSVAEPTFVDAYEGHQLLLDFETDMFPFPGPDVPKFTFIDLFAGIGGFRIAMQEMGGKCIFSSEFDSEAQKTYFSNYGEIPFGDITKIDEKCIPNHDVLCAGFPCQPFSISGKRLGFEDTRGTLFFDIARIAKEKQPAILFLENVKNLMSHNNGDTINQMMGILNDIGYDVQIKLLNAARYGVPQRRERVYIIGLRKDLAHDKFIYPTPLDLPVYIENILDDDPVAIKEATIHRTDIEFWPNDGHEEYALRPIRVGTVNKGGQGERIYSTKGVGVTLSAYGGGVGAKTGLYKINGNVRRLTPRECARVQSFPETFIIPNNRNIAYKQFGNSVSINVLRFLMESILNTNILNNAK